MKSACALSVPLCAVSEDCLQGIECSLSRLTSPVARHTWHLASINSTKLGFQSHIRTLPALQRPSTPTSQPPHGEPQTAPPTHPQRYGRRSHGVDEPRPPSVIAHERVVCLPARREPPVGLPGRPPSQTLPLAVDVWPVFLGKHLQRSRVSGRTGGCSGRARPQQWEIDGPVVLVSG